VEPTSPQAKPIVAPNGLDLHPAPQKTLRINRRASIIAGVVGLCFLVGWAYGGFQRSATTEQQARNKGVPKNIVPATTAGNEFTKEQSGGLDSLPMDSPSMHKLLPPASPEPAQVSRAVCGACQQE